MMTETELREIIRLRTKFYHPRTPREERDMLYEKLRDEHGVELESDGSRCSD